MPATTVGTTRAEPLLIPGLTPLLRSGAMESKMRFASLVIAIGLAISAATPAMACYKMTCNSPTIHHGQ